MTTLLLEPFGGMAGDMFLAALLDLGHPAFSRADLEELAAALVPDECELELTATRRGGLAASHLAVRTPESADPPHRHLADLVHLLERVSPELLDAPARDRTTRVLTRLGEAEAAVHGIPLERVHFHEVGAVDTLIDVAGACFALARLGVERVIATPPYVGGGTVRCAHGELPVPAPATQVLLTGIPHRRGTGGERLTPTAAALLAELAEFAEAPEDLVVERVGLGAGTRELDAGPPNALRVSLAHPVARGESEGEARAVAWLLECNLDDATGEELGFLVAELRRAGALEAWSVPVQMKKDRPGAVVSALARAAERGALEAVLFAHSPTLGVRWTRTERTECAREELTVEVAGETVRVKLRRRPGANDAPSSALDLSPEHDDLARLARATGRPLRELEREAIDRALAARRR